MVLKVVDATELRVGGFVIYEGEVYLIKDIDVSKTGKHGASKCRFQTISVMGDKKKIIMAPGGERFEVPMIEKRKAQVLSMVPAGVSLMDAESFENFELGIPEEFAGQITEGMTLEYWDVEGKKLIKRLMT